MLEKYRKAVNLIEDETATKVLWEFGVRAGWDPGKHLFDWLHNNGYGQSDLVLALLRINTPASLHYAGAIVGRPITICQPGTYQPTTFTACGSSTVRAVVWSDTLEWLRRLFGADMETHDPPADKRKIKSVSARPKNSCPFHRPDLLRVGASVAQLLRRGILRRDLAAAVRAGWVELEDA